MRIDADQLGLDLGDGIGLLLRRYYPVLLRQAFQDAGIALSMDLAFDVDNPFVQATLADLARLVRGVADTTREEIRALIGRQADEGWSIARLADEIRAHGVTASTARAEAIARTETAAAYSRGSLLAYEESGVVGAVEWLAGPDECPECAALSGTRAPLGATFADGTPHPPKHPNCRCTLLPVLE